MLATKFWLFRALSVIAAVGIICAIAAAEFRLHTHIKNTTVDYSLLLAVLFFAVRWDRVSTIAAALAASLVFLIYFQEPIGSLKATNPESYIEVGAFLVTAIIVSQTALQARLRTAEAIERRLETERLYEFGQAMLAAESLQTAIWIAINRSVPIFDVAGAAFFLNADSTVHRSGESAAITDQALRAVASNNELCFDPAAGLAMIPLHAGQETVGTIGFSGGVFSETVLKSIASLLEVVLERVQAGEKLQLANRELEQRHQQVEEQKRVSESLLLNILPAEVADELRNKGMVAPKYFEDVTILFTDFVGFTLSTEKLAAEELVERLHDYFTAFDRIAARYRLEKMKTIGDSYMCIGGLPLRNPAHPVDMVMAAFEMLQAVTDRAHGSVPWKVRIGIHTGPVIAGVVGINKFAFDIWGDTVNYSSRMESSGQPNRINLSERTYSRVKDFFECEHRGQILTKEKREMDMYFANGILPSLMSGSGEIPPPAFLRRYHVYFQKDPPAFPAFLAQQAQALPTLSG